MAQRPNIELGISDLPRPTRSPGPARRWTLHRPGDPTGEEDPPWGGLYGTPGPDAGYVLALVADVELAIDTGESRDDARQAVAVLAAARASLAGRGPTRGDVDAACMLLGYSDRLDEPTRRRLAKLRYRRVNGMSHDAHAVAALIERVDVGLLGCEPSRLAAELQSGSSPFTDE